MKRLYTTIYVHLLGMLALVGVVTGTVFTSGFRTAYLHGLTERLVRHGASLVGDRFGDPEQRAQIVARLARELEVDITVRDSDGRALDVAGTELPMPTPSDERALSQSGATVIHFHKGWYAAAPILDGRGRVVGTVEATPVRHMRQPSLWRPVSMVLVVLGLVAAFAAPLARRISQPVERLMEATMRFGAGDLSSRVRVSRRPGRGGDELSRLTSAWNDMAERVERLVRGQKDLLANVSHELRSPLARIRVALELLPQDGESEARLRDVQEDLAELDRLIEDTLTASRLEAGGFPAHFGTVELAPLLASLVERARVDPQLRAMDVRLDTRTPASLVAVVDAALIKRALWNLMENAGKYGAAPITLRATVEPLAGAAEGRLELSVSDEGPGIPAAERKQVLEPFYRADHARTPSAKGAPARGVGLGLTIAHHVAQLHQGGISIAPLRTVAGVEQGCRISLVLPRERAAIQT